MKFEDIKFQGAILEPLKKALVAIVPHNRMAALALAQTHIRQYGAAVAAGTALPVPKHPMEHAVHELLTKALATTDVVVGAEGGQEQEADINASVDADLEALVKLQTIKAQERMEKGMLGAIASKIGVGRAAGMSAMRAGAKASKASAQRYHAGAVAQHASMRDSAYAGATRGMPAGGGRHARGMAAASGIDKTLGWIPKAAADNVKGAGRRGASDARDSFKRKSFRRATGAGLAAGAAGGAAAGSYSNSRSNRRGED